MSDNITVGGAAPTAGSGSEERPVPHSVIPCKHLPAATYNDLPEAPLWRKLIGPSILLLGLSLGSGEFVLWPYITYTFGFAVFWACMVGVTTQYFLNMEIERWTLATGETAITGFCRLWPHWAWIFLICNVVPWMWPGWASGAATILIWEIGGGETERVIYSILSLIAIGGALTLGPVVYNTVERLQKILIGFIFALMIVLFFLVVELTHIGEMLVGITNVGFIPDSMELPLLLGALAFAGAGGTMNLVQSNYVREKGYAMGRFAGRLTSPITGREEVMADIGYHFEHTAKNVSRWGAWWKAANREHAVSFYLLSVVSLMMLSLIAHATAGTLAGETESGFGFIRAEGESIGGQYGPLFQHAFHWMGIAILLTTELGLLDACARISTDIIKVNWLRDNGQWTDSRLYFALLWGQIGMGCLIMVAGIAMPGLTQPLVLLVLSAALNGGVMLIYSVLLLWMNSRVLGGELRTPVLRFLVLIWSCTFFGYFTVITLDNQLPKLFG
ncbi:MAG: Nramp family divalent metal transporter [Candidatus Latescibacterota bacterium]|nr:Nramp family divalent metal transporter [Candidatus Latescibacterota bacterium]